MKSAKEANLAAKQDSNKLFQALMKACEDKIKDAVSRGQFSVALKGSELGQRYTRDWLVEELRRAGYDVVKLVVVKYINDVQVEEVGEVVVKWEEAEHDSPAAANNVVEAASAEQEGVKKKKSTSPVSGKTIKKGK